MHHASSTTPLARGLPLWACMVGMAGVAALLPGCGDAEKAVGAEKSTASIAVESAAPPPVLAALPAALSVTATDGDELQVWFEREGEAPRRIEPEASDLPAGRVMLQVVRRIADGSLRADVVRMTLQSGSRHLVALGDAPLRARTKVEGRELDLAARFLPPGIVGVDDHEWRLIVADPVSGKQPPAAASAVSLTFGAPRREPEDLWLSAKDQILLIVNPYAEAVECRVAGGDWEHEFVLDGPVCRFIPVGSASTLKIVTRLLPGRELVEERTLTITAGLPLHTIGGSTIYRWIGNQEGKCPPAPEGALAILSLETRVRLPAAGDPGHWLLVSQLNGVVSGLSAFVSAPPAIRGEPRALTAQAGVKIVELEPPAALAGQVISGVATDGVALIAIANGVAVDFSSGQPLYDPAPMEISRAVAGPSGMVLLTRTGMLATVRDRKLVLGEPFYDPSLRLAPAAGPEPAVWMYAGAGDASLHLRLLDGSDSLVYVNWPGLTALCPVGPTTVLSATRRRIDRANLAGESNSLDPILLLPEDGSDIVSLAELDGRLLFSTQDTVSALQGNLVVPLVEGIGGDLLSWRDGLLVHDARTMRLYHLTGPALAPVTKKEDHQ